MQHHFGTGSVFLTVTFDDENSVLMQVLSGVRIDDRAGEGDTVVSDEDLLERAGRRRALRLQYPGLAAINFKMKLQILMEEVIGWDMKNGRSTEKMGLFGDCQALSLAVEEQGRKTLHVHMTLYIEGYEKLRQEIFSRNGNPAKFRSLSKGALVGVAGGCIREVATRSTDSK